MEEENNGSDKIVLQADEFMVTKIDLAAWLDRLYGQTCVRAGTMPSKLNRGKKVTYFIFKKSPVVTQAMSEFNQPKEEWAKKIMLIFDGQRSFRQIKNNLERMGVKS